MMLKQNFADQLKAESEIWKAQVKDYQGRVEQAGGARNAASTRRVWRRRRHGRTWSGQARRLSSNFRGAGPTQFLVSSETIAGGIGRRRHPGTASHVRAHQTAGPGTRCTGRRQAFFGPNPRRCPCRRTVRCQVLQQPCRNPCLQTVCAERL